MGHGALERVSMRRDLEGELVLESGEHIIEGKSVRGQVHPS